MGMKYVVTGGAGFIGNRVVRQLVEAGHKVTVIDDLSTGKLENLPTSGVELVRADFADRDALRDILNGADGVFHLAAFIDLVGSFPNIEECVRTNIDKSVVLLNECVKHKVPRFVFSSSAAVYESGNTERHEGPISPYGSSKLFFEQVLRQFATMHHFSAVCLRYFNVYGGRQALNSQYAAVIPKFIKQALREKPLTIFGAGTQRRDFIHVSDVAAANVAAMREADGSAIYDVGTGRSSSILDLAKALNDALGRDIPITHEPRPPVDADDSVADVSGLKKKCGWAPKVALQDGLRETVEWFRTQL